MEFFRRTWATIRTQLEGLTASQKWLIATLLVLGLTVVGILLTVAGSAEMVPISQFASSRGDEVLARLRGAGIAAEKEGSQIRVPVEKREDAILLLVEGDLLAEDSSLAFDLLVQSQSPWASDAQNAQATLVAKQKYLANILRRMPGVKTADVVVDMPRNRGFGGTYVKPSASVTIATSSRSVDRKQLVEAAAALVSGAVAEMPLDGVNVIVDGQRMRVDDPSRAMPTEVLELVTQLEDYHQAKIVDHLSYIPGVRVAVSVQLDNVSSQSQVERQYDRSEPLRREYTKETQQRDVRDGGEPGVTSNTGLDINAGRSRGTEQTTSETENEFGDKPLVMERESRFAGHATKRINVTINVPRTYFVQLFRAQNPAAAAEPDDAALAPLQSAELAKIQSQIEPLIQTVESQGQVVAVAIPDDSVLAPRSPEASSGGLGSVLVDSGWAKPVGVGGLALVSLALMLFMVRKATQQERLPSVEELAGVPPRLPAEDELVGEADEMEATMAGVELDESELHSRKIAQQIGELIKANPDEAGGILGRWVRRED